MSLLLLSLCLITVCGFLGYRAYIIRSGSMVPVLPIGSVVIDRNTNPVDLGPGDIVTFRDPDLSNQLVTHRIQQMLRVGNQVRVITKGDANLSTERWSAAESVRLGREVVEIPYIGYWLAYTGTPNGRVVEVIAAFLWIGYLVMRWLWKPSEPKTAPRSTTL